RRLFLGGSAATLGYFLTADAFSAARAGSSLETIRFVGVGVGGKGQSDIMNAAKVGPVVALCDIDDNRLNDTLNAKERKGGEAILLPMKPKHYQDYRKMFDEMEKEFDAATVS